jgi:hypothetical protein
MPQRLLRCRGPRARVKSAWILRNFYLGILHCSSMNCSSTTYVHRFCLSFSFHREKLNLLHKQLWHLLPCLHIPTYRADFSSGRDRLDPEFLALVLSIQATVFMAVPRKWLPPGLTNGLRQLTERCICKSRALLDQFGEVSSRL